MFSEEGDDAMSWTSSGMWRPTGRHSGRSGKRQATFRSIYVHTQIHIFTSKLENLVSLLD